MLDENAGSKFDSIGMNAMANKDKAGRVRFEPAHASPRVLEELQKLTFEGRTFRIQFLQCKIFHVPIKEKPETQRDETQTVVAG